MGARNIFGAFLIAAILFSFWPFVLGRYQEIGALRDALGEREVLVEHRRAALDTIAIELERYNAQLTGDDQDKFSAMVPSHRDTASILSGIDVIANGTGMILSELAVSEPRSQQQGMSNIELSLSLEGTYASFRSFLTQLEQSVRLLDIQTITITENQQTPGSQRYELTAHAYFLR
jgi:Tfp pilus assembly protein PilO